MNTIFFENIVQILQNFGKKSQPIFSKIDTIKQMYIKLAKVVEEVSKKGFKGTPIYSATLLLIK